MTSSKPETLHLSTSLDRLVLLTMGLVVGPVGPVVVLSVLATGDISWVSLLAWFLPLSAAAAGGILSVFGRLGGNLEFTQIQAIADGRRVSRLLNYGLDAPWIEIQTETGRQIRSGEPAEVAQALAKLQELVPPPALVDRIDGFEGSCAPRRPLLDAPVAILWAVVCVSLGALPALLVVLLASPGLCMLLGLFIGLVSVALPAAAVGVHGTRLALGLPTVDLEVKGHTVRLTEGRRSRSFVVQPDEVRVEPHAAGATLVMGGESVMVTTPFALAVADRFRAMRPLQGDASAVPDALLGVRRRGDSDCG